MRTSFCKSIKHLSSYTVFSLVSIFASSTMVHAQDHAPEHPTKTHTTPGKANPVVDSLHHPIHDNDHHSPKHADSVKRRAIEAAAVGGGSKEEKNRNVLLNAASNSGPRIVNIGLPSNAGGTTVMENSLGVIYSFWPEVPRTTWRASQSLMRAGLMSLRESTIINGDFGYAVNSFTRLGGDKFQLNGSLSGSHFGWIKADVNASGPISKSLFYTAGAFLNFDPQSFDPKFTKYTDKTKIYRAGLTKRYKKGEVSLLYKYANAALLDNNAVFRYKEGGEVEELPNFKIGRDSYLPQDGQMRYMNAETGQFYNVDLGKAGDINIESHNIDLLGTHKLRRNWTLKYIARYHQTVASNAAINYTATKMATAASGFKYADGTPYIGEVQTAFTQHVAEQPFKHFLSRIEITKQVRRHSLRIGATHTGFDEGNFSYDRSFFYQEVAANPRRLYNTGTVARVTGFTPTDQHGFFNYNQGVPYHGGKDWKTAVYFSDDWVVSPKLTVSYGTNLRYQNMNGNFYSSAKPANFNLVGKQTTKFDYDWYHASATLYVVYNITKQFGVLGDFIYNERHGQLQDHAATTAPPYPKTRTPYASVGVYLNHPKISLVSAVTYLTRNAYNQRLNLVNPDNVTEAVQTAVQYDIKTTGWTTDIVYKPFKGFELHYLLTLQNPVYQNYNINAFGKAYNYDGKYLTGISRVLQEIDPSYTTADGKWKIWASLRSFSKQYANQTNVLFFKGWWETFMGANYKISKKTGVGVTVLNPLNQRGAKSIINGAELITDPAPYYNQIMSSDYILPFTVQSTITFKL